MNTNVDTKLRELEQRIAQLEAHLAATQAYPPQPTTNLVGATLVTPIQIVSRDGQLLATFEQRLHDLSLRLFNQHGIAAASIGVDGTNAGYLAIRNAEGVLVALLDVETWGARLQLEDHTHSGGLTLFGGDGGDDAGGGIQVNHTAGGVSLALWSTPTGGKIVVYDGQPDEVILASIPPKL